MPRLPPLPALLPFFAHAEAAGAAGEPGEFEELALRFAGAVVETLADAGHAAGAVSGRDERRITEAVRRIKRESHGSLPLATLAREAAMSPYHFLRTFHRVVGVTPHQFVLRTRLHRAAVRLRLSDEPVAAIALDAGFNDVSTFNRRFRRWLGMSPGDYREMRSG